LRAFGYTPRQADFLAHVALHGAHFLRRQYISYTGSGHGLATVRFLQRLIGRRHVRQLSFGRHGHVYHLCARSIYRACGLERRRWGREASWQRVIEAVTMLDFALAHAADAFLVTDEDKARALTEAGLERGAWPMTQRGGRQAQRPSEDQGRFDHRPWYVDQADRRLWLVYVDSAATPTAFRTFLLSHVLLLHGIPSGVAYVSQSTTPARVRQIFARVVRDEAAIPRKMAAEFLFYCRLRRAVEISDLRPYSVQEIRRFRHIRPMFANRRCDELYRRWLGNSDASQIGQHSSTGQDVDCVLKVHPAQALLNQHSRSAEG
jgi:hypothetical protein